MSKRTTNCSSEKWLISKMDEHDRQLKDIFQLLKELKAEIDVIKKGPIEEIWGQIELSISSSSNIEEGDDGMVELLSNE